MHSEDPENVNPEEQSNQQEPSILRVSGMYQEYFLDYASYVILERAVPALSDGLKPVQRRLLHSLKEMDDGRYHKVANIIGHTMKYHPHGDASIGDALVQLGQKDLLIDMQGNWGNILTGDSAAAPRYIEARLTKFALEVAYSPKVTEWQSSYDSRGKEPVHLPMKFPLVLALGAEGIAVGLSTKILPHNFNELIDGSIKVLRGRKAVIYPDFATGGIADFTQYNDGLRGGKVRVRAKISQRDTKSLIITEIPFGTTTQSLIDSILKANDKGKIKIKKIEDNTAENVEIIVYLPAGISPDKTIDALYAFTDCEVSVSPNICVIHQDKPVFVGASELLKDSAWLTKDVLEAEQKIKLNELQEQWHFASLERIFIEKKIYRDIEEAETWEEVISFIRKGLEPHIKNLIREVTDDDIVRLTEIRIKRISKFDSSKADDHILNLEGQIEEVKNNLANIIDFTVDYYKNLKKKYGKGRERKTEIRTFDDINAKRVAIANQKLYVNREEGFIGTSLKRDEFVTECSDIDDIIVFLKSGKMKVVPVDSKTFIGKGILHIAVFKKKDKRTVYNLIYRDGRQGNSYMKRFNVTSITRDREYDLGQGKPGTTVLYFTANPNGEAETITVHLKALQKLKKLKWDINFADLAIKGRASKGNLLTKFPVRKIELKEQGVSTLAARKIWFDNTVNRLNVDGRGDFLGAFKGEDKILTIMSSGYYRLMTFDLSNHFEDDMILIRKWDKERPINAVYFDGGKERYYVKRFIPEVSDKKELFITEHPNSQLEIATVLRQPSIEVTFKKIKGKERENLVVDLAEFIAVKGMKALGNQLTPHPVKVIDLKESDEVDEVLEEEQIDDTTIESPKEEDDDAQITLEL
jgi:topoisomerase-4 subunit A